MTSRFFPILCSHKCLTRKEVWPDDDTWEPSHPPHGNLPCMSSQKPKMLPWRGRADRRFDHLWWSVGRWLDGTSRRKSREIHLKGQEKAGLAHRPETKMQRSVSKQKGSLVSGWAQQGSGGRSHRAPLKGLQASYSFNLLWRKDLHGQKLWSLWASGLNDDIVVQTKAFIDCEVTDVLRQA